jgi:hypothetical protein
MMLHLYRTYSDWLFDYTAKSEHRSGPDRVDEIRVGHRESNIARPACCDRAPKNRRATNPLH